MKSKSRSRNAKAPAKVPAKAPAKATSKASAKSTAPAKTSSPAVTRAEELSFSNGVFQWGVTLPSGWTLREPPGKTGEGEFYGSPDGCRGLFLSVWVLPIHNDRELDEAIRQFCQMERDTLSGMPGHHWKLTIRATPREKGARTLLLDAAETTHHSRIVIKLLARDGCIVTGSFHDYAYFGRRASDAWIRPLLKSFKVLSIAAAAKSAATKKSRSPRPAAVKKAARARGSR